MNERIIDIIIFLLEEFKQPKSRDEESYSNLSKQLMSQGYTENEINLAFSWIFNHLQKKDQPAQEEFQYEEGSVRILHEVEKVVISPEAYGYLLQLSNLGLLSDYDLETVIDRALSSGSTSITLDDIKTLVAPIILETDLDNPMDGFFYYSGKNTVH